MARTESEGLTALLNPNLVLVFWLLVDLQQVSMLSVAPVYWVLGHDAFYVAYMAQNHGHKVHTQLILYYSNA